MYLLLSYIIVIHIFVIYIYIHTNNPHMRILTPSLAHPLRSRVEYWGESFIIKIGKVRYRHLRTSGLISGGTPTGKYVGHPDIKLQDSGGCSSSELGIIACVLEIWVGMAFLRHPSQWVCRQLHSFGICKAQC